MVDVISRQVAYVYARSSKLWPAISVRSGTFFRILGWKVRVRRSLGVLAAVSMSFALASCSSSDDLQLSTADSFIAHDISNNSVPLTADSSGNDREYDVLQAPEYDVMHVFYGTDRVRKDDADRPRYTTTRAKRLETGLATVTVPKSHRVPDIERPTIYRIPLTQVVLHEEKEDPAKHFTIASLEVWDKEAFARAVNARIVGGSKHALVFVHGFNTTFDAALYRAGQLAYDLQFDGKMFMYSWPSRGQLGATDYNYDRGSAEVAEPYLKEFLEIITRQEGIDSVSIIAHSMGNKLLMPVLAEMRNSGSSSKIAQVILAAPDVSRDRFEQLADAMSGAAKGVTLYAAGNDRALQASRRYAGGVPRAGDVPEIGPLVVTGIDTIDVTAASTEVLSINHSGYAEKSALLTDISLLLKSGVRPPEQRLPILRRVNTQTGPYWRYPG